MASFRVRPASFKKSAWINDDKQCEIMRTENPNQIPLSWGVVLLFSAIVKNEIIRLIDVFFNDIRWRGGYFAGNYWELTYPHARHVWRWFSFYQEPGGICDRFQEGSFIHPFSMVKLTCHPSNKGHYITNQNLIYYIMHKGNPSKSPYICIVW